MWRENRTVIPLNRLQLSQCKMQLKLKGEFYVHVRTKKLVYEVASITSEISFARKIIKGQDGGKGKLLNLPICKIILKFHVKIIVIKLNF